MSHIHIEPEIGTTMTLTWLCVANILVATVLGTQRLNFVVRQTEAPTISDPALASIIQQVCKAGRERRIESLVDLSDHEVLLAGGEDPVPRERLHHILSTEPKEFWEDFGATCEAGFAVPTAGIAEAPFVFLEDRAEITREGFIVSAIEVRAEAAADSAVIATTDRGVVRLAHSDELTRGKVKEDPLGRYIGIASQDGQVGYVEKSRLVTYGCLVIQLERARAGWRLTQLRYD